MTDDLATELHAVWLRGPKDITQAWESVASRARELLEKNTRPRMLIDNWTAKGIADHLSYMAKLSESSRIDIAEWIIRLATTPAPVDDPDKEAKAIDKLWCDISPHPSRVEWKDSTADWKKFCRAVAAKVKS